jgi:GTP-binding protein
MFVDKAKITIRAGKGGDGCISYRQEKFVDRGGPDGGDGGHGGDVIFVASRNENTLSDFRHNKLITAEDGRSGFKQKKHGRNGKDYLIKVPIGTVIYDSEGKTLADLVIDGQQNIIAAGGRGGFGNAHFVSSVRQAPGFAENGEKTIEMKLILELKIIAEVGLVGLPNAGKSTLLGSISNAKPEIADYPFTTLTPNLGVVDIDPQTSLLFADIPGIIEGASEGKGLGIDFLKHIERTVVLVHLVDIYNEDLFQAYSKVKNELKAYQIDLTKKPELVVASKIDGMNKSDLELKLKKFKSLLPPKTEVLAISALSHEGINELFKQLKIIVLKERARQSRKTSKKKVELPTITLVTPDNSWNIIKKDDVFYVTGAKIERFASRTDFKNGESVARMKDIFKKMGIIRELNKKGLKSGDKIEIGSYGRIEY